MDKDALLTREDDAWHAFSAVFDAVAPERRPVEGVVPGWSTHDLVWHCAFWADYAGQMLERIRGGDLDPDDFDGPESEILEAGRALTWDDVLKRADQARARVRSALTMFDDVPPKALEWFEDDTFGHYDEHGAQVRAFNR